MVPGDDVRGREVRARVLNRLIRAVSSRSEWYAKYRLPDGRQVQRRIGPHWSDRSSTPPPGHFTKRTAQAWLDEMLVKARRGEFTGRARTGVTFAGACDEWIEWKRSRRVRPSTLADYQNVIDRIKPMFAEQIGDRARLEQIDLADLETFRDRLVAAGSSDRTTNKYLGVLSDLFSWAAIGLPARR